VLEDGLADHRPGVGDEGVDAVEPLDGCARRLRIGHVHAARPFGRLDLPAVAAQPLGDRAPDPAASARDEDDLSSHVYLLNRDCPRTGHLRT